MARQLRIEFPDAFYHVTSRGNERKAVFKSFRDREKFLSYLESATKRYGAVIHVYCLMDNHYHLFIETPAGNLSQIMQHINGAYTAYFNKKHERSGHLFHGRYKAILVEADEYAKELSRYIHLNPVRATKLKIPEEYKWSSCQYYTVNRKAPSWLQRDFILGYFDTKRISAMRKYRNFVRKLIGQDYKSPLKGVQHSVILGSAAFIKDIKHSFLRNRRIDRELPILRETIDRPKLETIEHVVDSELESDVRLARQLKLFLCHSYSGMKLREIGDRFSVSESAVTQASRRVRIKLKNDKNVEKLILKIVKKLPLSNV
jgi:putative transposase